MNEIFVKDRIEAGMEILYNFMRKNKALYHLAAGYLFGIFVDSINDLKEIELAEILENVFSMDKKPANAITYLALFILILYVVLPFLLKMYFKNKTPESRLRRIYEKNIDPVFTGLQIQGIGWGLGQTVQRCPTIEEGWSTKDLRFEVDNSLYDLNLMKEYDATLSDRDLNAEYEKYCEGEFRLKYNSDSDRLMMTHKPRALTDDNALLIRLKKLKWSQYQFFLEKVTTSEREKWYFKQLFQTGNVTFPNSFCLHLVVMTSDGKILITKNSVNKPNDYQDSWAVSIGEQIDASDIQNLSDDCAYRWVSRALIEEIGELKDAFNKNGIHFLSVNLEGDHPNLAIVCVVTLLRNAEYLANVLNNGEALDHEFSSFDFLQIDDLPEELIHGRYPYHPSSKIRMFYTYLHRRGASQLKEQLLHYEYRKTKRKQSINEKK